VQHKNGKIQNTKIYNRVSTTPGNPGNLLEFSGPPGNFYVLVSGHKRLAFHCLDTDYGFNNDDVSLYIEQCNIKNVANVVIG